MKRQIRSFLVRRPTLYYLSYFIRHRFFHDNIVTKDTQLVVEAPPRSANTFCVHGLQFVNNDKLVIAHHLHRPVQTIYGVKNNIPCVVIIRNPIDCCISMAIYFSYSNLKSSLERYIDFYTPLLPYKERILFVSFEDTTKNLPIVIKKINEYHNMDLLNFSDSIPFIPGLIFKRIDDFYKKIDGNIKLERVSRPSKERDQIKFKFKKELKSDNFEFKELLKKAEDIYKTISLLVKHKESI